MPRAVKIDALGKCVVAAGLEGERNPASAHIPRFDGEGFGANHVFPENRG